MRAAPSIFAGIAIAAVAGPALAADLPATTLPPPPVMASFAMPSLSGAYIHVGATGLFTDPKMAATLGGAPFTNAAVTIPPVITGSAEVGYFFTGHIAVSVMGGWPPPVSAYGSGALAPFGKLFTQIGGVALVSVHYHWDLGRLHPYLGGGVGRSITFHNSANPVFQNFHVGNAFAPVLVVGADVDITEHVSVFFDVKKIWISQMAEADVAVAPGVVLPISARLRTDPLVTTAGVGYRF